MEEPEVELENNSVEDVSDESLPIRYSITSYGADYPVDSLVKRMANGSIYVPKFQRGYVWKITEASRFIESLLLGLPVPGIFLAKEQDTQKLLVIDGQQRLRTIEYFYSGVFQDTGIEFKLKGISPQFEGLTYKTLSEEDRRGLDDSIIPTTVVRQDEPSDDNSSIYHVFERLNTGGVKLQPQEIRACIYRGEFNELLAEINTNQAWRNIYGSVDQRMKDQELILRFLALYFEGEHYQKPMKGFLNQFMAKNRTLTKYSSEQIKEVFNCTIETAYKCLGEQAFKPKKKLNAAVFDAVMVGLYHRLKHGSVRNEKSVQSIYQSLLDKKEFLDVTTETARTTEKNVIESRLNQSIDAFSKVEYCCNEERNCSWS